MISRPVPVPLYPIHFDPLTNTPRCGCPRGVDCIRIGKHAAVPEFRDLKYGDEVPEPVPGAGVAIKTGPHPLGSDVIVVDLDGTEAVEAWDAMHAASGEPELDTRTVGTGGGTDRYQLYFQCEPGLDVRNSRSKLGPHIDIRGYNGLAVVEGSPHKSSPDARYVLLSDEDTPPAPMPRWLVAWFEARASERPDTTQRYDGDVTDPDELEYRRELYADYLANEAEPSIAYHGGDEALFKAVQRGAYDLALPVDDVLELVEEHFDPRCQPPWGEALFERVVHKATSAKTTSIRPRIEPPPNPARPAGARLAELLGTGPAQDPHELDLEAIEAALPAGAALGAAGGIGLQFGGWDSEPPPVEFVVDGLVPVGAVGMFYGEADSLKTWLMFSLAIAVARGEHWLGRRVKVDAEGRRLKVAIVDYETGSTNLRRRLYMLRAGSLRNLGAVAFPRCEKPNEAEFWAKLAEDDVDFVVVDSLRMANPGANENDNSEAIRPLEHASAFTETCLRVSNGKCNPTVVFIHHTKKSTDGDGWPTPRGAQAIIDQCDFAYAVRQVDKDEASPQLKRVEVKCHKPGDMVLPLPFAAEVRFDDVAKLAEIVEAEFAREGSGSGSAGDDAGATGGYEGEDLHEAEIQRRILAALAAGPLPTKDKVVNRVGGRKKAVLAEIDALVAGGRVIKIKDVGYDLESPERRRARVLEQVKKYDRWSSAAKLASAAHVTTEWVEGMVREGYIVPRISSGPSAPGGYLALDRGAN